MCESPSSFSNALRILLVEDDPFDAELLTEVLTTHLPCRIRVALTRGTFEAELERELLHIIVSDSNVRAFDGMTALKIACERCPDIPFVFCSGNYSEAKSQEALAQGAAGWVTKDDSFSQLVLVIKRLRPFQAP